MAMDFINGYVGMIHKATQKDPIVHKQFLKVMNLLATPTSLLHPRIVWRVLRHQLTKSIHS